MKSRLKIKFEESSNGWYPITVSNGHKNIQFVASNVPFDPVLELIDAVENCFLHGVEAEALMHLEPSYFKWRLVPKGEFVELNIFFVEEKRSLNMPGNTELKGNLELQYSGESRDVLLAIWWGLREFCSRETEYQKALVHLDRKVKEFKL